jgi:uncharacterized protein YfiM (DUF2279 family)
LSIGLLTLLSLATSAQELALVSGIDSAGLNTGPAFSMPAVARKAGDHLPPTGRILSPAQVKSRTRFVAISNGLEYSALLVGLNAEWYANYPRSSFHSFDDNAEWLQVDKVGHAYSAYIESRMSMELWRWTGIERKKRIWYGGLSGMAYQTLIEVLDGFSAEWGWSWGDFGANIVGSGSMIAQELAWNDQRIKLKFSFHKNNYGDPLLDARANQIFGKTITERFIKDYNAQTYWASANLRAFFSGTRIPGWLAVAIGYGAEGMFGARGNTAHDDNGINNFDRTDVRRYRQWYLSPDIDFTKIPTRKKGVRLLFTIMSAFKFPAPSLEFSKGSFRVNALHF